MVTSGDVDSTRFATTHHRRGYDERSVDLLLASIHATLRAYETGRRHGVELRADEVVAARFLTTHYRRGYDQSEVDDFLDAVIATLRSFESQPHPQAGPTPPPAADPVAAPPNSPAPRESLGRRLLRVLRGDPPPG